VSVSVDESRDERLSGQIDHLGVRTAQRQQFVV
jgi:hypothetical protein